MVIAVVCVCHSVYRLWTRGGILPVEQHQAVMGAPSTGTHMQAVYGSAGRMQWELYIAGEVGKTEQQVE